MTGAAESPRPPAVSRLVPLLPYAGVAAGLPLAPTQALMLAWVGSLLCPAGARPLHTTAGHLSMWALLLALLPDPFPWWQAPVLSLLLGLSLPRWQPRPRLAALAVALLGLPALVDLSTRLDPQADVAAAAARNPWTVRPALEEHGQLATLDLGPGASPLAIVVPARFAPWPLQADRASRIRGGVLVAGGLLLVFLLQRRSPWPQLGMVLPVLLAWGLTRPPTEARLWIEGPGEEWILTCDAYLQESLRTGSGEALELVRPPEGLPRPGEAVAWVRRGALVAPEEGGEPAYRPLLSHWADATLAPTERATAAAAALTTARRWETDAEGHILLRPLP